MSLPLPVLQGYTFFFFFEFRLQKKLPKFIGAARLPVSLI